MVEVLDLSTIKPEVKKKREKHVVVEEEPKSMKEFLDKYTYEKYVEEIAKKTGNSVEFLLNHSNESYRQFRKNALSKFQKPKPFPSLYSQYDAIKAYNDGEKSTLNPLYTVINGRIVNKKSVPRASKRILFTPGEWKYNRNNPPTLARTSDDEVTQQRIDVYNGNIADNFAPLRNDGRLNQEIVDYINSNPLGAYTYDSSNNNFYELVTSEMLKSNGNILINTKASPVYPAYFMINRIFNKVSKNRIVFIRDSMDVTNLLVKPYYNAGGVEFTVALIEYPTHGFVFHDITCYEIVEAYQSIITFYDPEVLSLTKILLVASLIDFGNSLSDFYRSMGLDLFNYLFKPSNGGNTLYNEAISNMNITPVIARDMGQSIFDYDPYKTPQTEVKKSDGEGPEGPEGLEGPAASDEKIKQPDFGAGSSTDLTAEQANKLLSAIRGRDITFTTEEYPGDSFEQGDYIGIKRSPKENKIMPSHGKNLVPGDNTGASIYRVEISDDKQTVKFHAPLRDQLKIYNVPIANIYFKNGNLRFMKVIFNGGNNQTTKLRNISINLSNPGEALFSKIPSTDRIETEALLKYMDQNRSILKGAGFGDEYPDDSDILVKPLTIRNRGHQIKDNPFAGSSHIKPFFHNSSGRMLTGGAISDINKKFKAVSMSKLGQGELIKGYSSFLYKFTLAL